MGDGRSAPRQCGGGIFVIVMTRQEYRLRYRLSSEGVAKSGLRSVWFVCGKTLSRMSACSIAAYGLFSSVCS